MSKRIPVIVVSGFLGSGKTTFLRHFLQKTNKIIGLLINEFGDVGIDGDLLKSCNSCNINQSDSIIELNNGCLCCTVQEDFIPSIKNLLHSNLGIETIIIETSGLALPIPLLKALNWPEIRSLIYLDSVITIVNGESLINGSPINDLFSINNQYKDTKIINHISSVEELFEKQLEVADIVLISRSDLINENQFDLIKNQLKNKINTNVPILKSFKGETNLEYILDTKVNKINHQKILIDDNDHEHTHAQIYSDYFYSDYFLEKNQFELEMNHILKDINVLRIKGRIWIPQKTIPLQVQIVGKKISTWYEKAPDDNYFLRKNGGTELILIGFDKSHFETIKNKIKEKFNILTDTKSGK